jgi:hypothetical protein
VEGYIFSFNEVNKKKTYSISKDGQLSALALHAASRGTG